MVLHLKQHIFPSRILHNFSRSRARLKADLRNCETVTDQPVCGGTQVTCCTESKSGDLVAIKRPDVLTKKECSGVGQRTGFTLAWNPGCVDVCPQEPDEGLLGEIKQSFRVSGEDYRFIRSMPVKRPPTHGLFAPVYKTKRTTDEKQNGQRAFEIIEDIGQKAFNDAFAASDTRIIKRLCASCSSSVHQEIYYRRHSPIPDNLDTYHLITRDWTSKNNEMGLDKDFTIHSTYAEAITGEFTTPALCSLASFTHKIALLSIKSLPAQSETYR